MPSQRGWGNPRGEVTPAEIIAWRESEKAFFREAGASTEVLDDLDSKTYDAVHVRDIQIHRLLIEIAWVLVDKFGDKPFVGSIVNTLIVDSDEDEIDSDFELSRSALRRLLERVQQFRENLLPKDLELTFYHAVKRSFKKPEQYDAVLSDEIKQRIAKRSLSIVAGMMRRLQDNALSDKKRLAYQLRIAAFVSNPKFYAEARKAQRRGGKFSVFSELQQPVTSCSTQKNLSDSQLA